MTLNGFQAYSMVMKRYRADNRLDITDYRIQTDNPFLTEPVTIALISDLHDRPYARVMASLASRKPDLIAIAGDLVDGYAAEGMEDVARGLLTRMPQSVLAPSFHILSFLKDCAAVAPTYFSLGNHEWLLSDSDYDRIRQTGVHLLDNASVAFSHRFLIGGLTSSSVMRYRKYILENPEMKGYYPMRPPVPFWKKRRSRHPLLDYNWLSRFEGKKGFKLLLSHHPEYWKHRDPVLQEMNLDIVMSGHAHGGQIRLLRHGLYAPGQGLLPKYTCGVHRGSFGSLIVSRGLANTVWIPRFGNCPELVYIKVETRRA